MFKSFEWSYHTDRHQYYNDFSTRNDLYAELFEDTKFQIDYDVAQRHFNGQITDEEFVNAVFEPQEQVNGKQAELLGVAFTLAAGGPAQAHVGTGGGGSSSELPWSEQKKKNPQRGR